MSKNILYLIDGNSLVYRSYYAIKLSNSRGFPTGAIFGFLNAMRKILQKYQPQFMAVCFDVSRKTHRQEKFKAYKIQRPPAPDALKMQMPPIKELLCHLGISIVEKENYEADDLISSLTYKAYEKGWNVVIISSDKDMYQLIKDDAVYVYNPVKDVVYDHAHFIDEFGFIPRHIVDYLALVGDSVDNIPGAKGIGKVGALTLIKQFGTIEKIFASLDAVTGKMKTILENNKDNIVLSKELVQLKDYLDADFNLTALKIRECDNDSLYKLCKEMGFKSVLKEIPQAEHETGVVIQEGFAPALKNRILSQKILFFYMAGGTIFVFDDGAKATHKVQYGDIKNMLADHGITKISYGFKQLFLTLDYGSDLRGAWFDIKIAAYLVNATLGDYSLENIVSHFLDTHQREISPSMYTYFIYNLYNVLRKKLNKADLADLFFKVEMPLTEVLARMERNGVTIDRKELGALTEDVERKVEDTTSEIFKIARHDFNLNSPKQLRKVLFEELKLPPQKKTKTGYSTDEEVLKSLSAHHPIAEMLLDYRHLSKLKSTYVGPFMEASSSQASKLHAHFNQTVTATGRLSSSSPNLQNIPIKREFAQQLRKVFVSSFKHGLILSSDYSQIELRILAHFSQEEKLIDAFHNNVDVHTHTASLLFDTAKEHIDRKKREIAKRVNFGIIYGMSSYGLAKELAIGEEEARAFIENYFLRYPKVKLFIEETVKKAKKEGFVTTFLGRRRYLPDIESPNHELREFSRRQAINTPIQGTAADLIKVAMVKIFQALEKENRVSQMVLQVHDELVFDVEKQEFTQVAEIAKFHMEQSLQLSVPIVANIKVGKNWLELEPVDL